MKIYVIQMHTGTWFSKVIKTITHYPYSHIGLSFDRECKVIYSFGRRIYNNPFSGGFVITKHDGPFFRKFNKTVCRIFELEVTDAQYEKLNSLLNEFIEHQDKYIYDYLGVVLRSIINMPISFNYRYVCSQFVAELLSKAGIAEFKGKPCQVRPRHFESLVGSTEIYSGPYPCVIKEADA